MRLICYPTGEVAPLIRPAPVERAWMDRSPDRFAYRCLPLDIANAHGWEILCPVSAEVVWNGGPAPGDLTVTADGAVDQAPISHFGCGVLTFHVPALFRTEPGIDLWVSGPVNFPKDGACALSGLVETDWAPYSFTMNWRLTRPGHPVRFEAGEPFCFFFPLRRGEVEACEPEIRPLSSDPATAEAHARWSSDRRRFLEELPLPGSEAQGVGWQKSYFKGKRPDGSAGPEDHRTRLSVKAFRDRSSSSSDASRSTQKPSDSGEAEERAERD